MYIDFVRDIPKNAHLLTSYKDIVNLRPAGDLVYDFCYVTSNLDGSVHGVWCGQGSPEEDTPVNDLADLLWQEGRL